MNPHFVFPPWSSTLKAARYAHASLHLAGAPMPQNETLTYPQGTWQHGRRLSYVHSRVPLRRLVQLLRS